MVLLYTFYNAILVHLHKKSIPLKIIKHRKIRPKFVDFLYKLTRDSVIIKKFTLINRVNSVKMQKSIGIQYKTA